MTPEKRAEAACRSLTIREVVMTMPGGVTASFEVVPVIAASIREAEAAARAEALEEAAKIAESHMFAHDPSDKTTVDASAGKIIAAAIRERAKGVAPESHDKTR